MEATLHRPLSRTDQGTYHLCVLVHGLWGNGSHLNYLTTSLRERHSDDELAILVCERNASSFTYDGIDVGAERVTREIEDTIEELKRDGMTVDRFSIVGYSLGGLIARYTVGLLDSRGYFERIRPVNFTTFASPHLGVRTPITGRTSHIWNALGARTLSASGRQLFTVDTFRDTGRPLLSILADPESIFIHALAKFENRCLYANIANDRTAVYYTTGISKTDPYAKLDKIKINYVDGYQDVILNPDNPYQVAHSEEVQSLLQRVKGTTTNVIRTAPIFAGLSVLIPIAVAVFLVNAGVQTVRSQKRILLHEQDTEETGFKRYRTSWMVQSMRASLENMYEATNSARQQEYLLEGEEALTSDEDQSTELTKERGSDISSAKSGPRLTRRRSSGRGRSPDFPTLALTSEQFDMIRALDDVGFKKFGVHIHNCRHSHAALIVRTNRKAFDEGKLVVKHWLDQSFIL